MPTPKNFKVMLDTFLQVYNDFFSVRKKMIANHNVWKKDL